MAIRAKLTTLEEMEARRNATGSDKPKRVISDEEKATRKERVVKAKDALARSVGLKGEHVVTGRATLKTYLQRLNEPKQPDDAQFEMLIEAPFKAPPKRRPTSVASKAPVRPTSHVMALVCSEPQCGGETKRRTYDQLWRWDPA